MSSRQCSVCGRDRVEVNFDTVENERGFLVDGDLFCLRCFLDTHPETVTTATLAKAPRRKVRLNPDWVTFRTQILAALERGGETFHYVNKDRCAGRCPICGESLGVRFKGQRPAVDLVCHGGCEERDIAVALRRAHDRR